MSETFQIGLRTPIGSYSGLATFDRKDEKLEGFVRTMGHTSPIENGKAVGNSLEFSGTLNTGFFNVRYAAKGTINGDRLELVAATQYGQFQITGTRVSRASK